MDIGFYIHSGSKTSFIGVKHKIDSQLTVFNRSWKTYEVVIEKKKTNILKSICWRLPFGSWGGKYEEALVDIEKKSHDNSVKFFYLRSQLFDRRYIGFLRELRCKYQEAKIILEIPTYPYGKELLSSKTMWPWFFKDIMYRHQIMKYINRIVTYTDDEYIYGIPTIRVKNGITVDKIQPIINEYNNEIHLLAVAQFQKSHGYERVIKGLNRYYKMEHSENVILNMVGYGTEISYYKKLVAKYNLEDKVIFHGYKQGDDLNKIYAFTDVALGVFGLYKRGISKSSALKIREYLAYGLPVVSGCREDAFDNNLECEFYKEYSNDNSDINIHDMVLFYNRLKKKYSKYSLRKLIHEYAKENVDMEITMQDIITYIA